jgi:hypothetical protein
MVLVPALGVKFGMVGVMAPIAFFKAFLGLVFPNPLGGGQPNKVLRRHPRQQDFMLFCRMDYGI